MIAATICFGGMSSLFANPEPLATIQLLPEAQVSGVSILLGDIAEIASAHEGDPSEDGGIDFANVYVGTAPLPGNSRQITIGQIEIRLRQAGIHPNFVLLVPPAKGFVKVMTRTQTVSSGMIVEAVKAAVLERLSDDLIVGVEVRDAVPLAVPWGELELKANDVPADIGSYRVGVDINIDGHRYRTVQTRVELKDAQSPTAVVMPQQSTEPLLVRRGERIIIEARHGGITVKVQGTALEAGRLGDFIRVENTESREEILARIVDKGIVMPEF